MHYPRIFHAGCASVLLILALPGCGTTTSDLAGTPPEARWSFSTNILSTSDCLAKALNQEYQPKTSGEQFAGRSIGHQVLVIEPEKKYQVVHEHISPYTSWLFNVEVIDRRVLATAHILHAPTFDRNFERM